MTLVWAITLASVALGQDAPAVPAPVDEPMSTEAMVGVVAASLAGTGGLGAVGKWAIQRILDRVNALLALEPEVAALRGRLSTADATIEALRARIDDVADSEPTVPPGLHSSPCAALQKVTQDHIRSDGSHNALAQRFDDFRRQHEQDHAELRRAQERFADRSTQQLDEILSRIPRRD